MLFFGCWVSSIFLIASFGDLKLFLVSSKSRRSRPWVVRLAWCGGNTERGIKGVFYPLIFCWVGRWPIAKAVRSLSSGCCFSWSLCHQH